jgi:hypothetical protein
LSGRHRIIMASAEEWPELPGHRPIYDVARAGASRHPLLTGNRRSRALGRDGGARPSDDRTP